MIDIRTGDALAVLREMPAESVQCVVTSPPYYALRDYGVEGQIGLEDSLREFLAKLVDVFREVRRVLRADGVAWVNMGDGYNANTGAGFNGNAKRPEEARETQLSVQAVGLRPKNLLGVPWRLAFALQDDGWYLRSDCIWHKPNPMPESVTDRPTKGHEYVFLFAKSARYFYDADAVREPQVAPGAINHGGGYRYDGTGRAARGTATRPGESLYNPLGRNIRTVWTIPTEPLREKHFAAFPTELARRCILAGSSAHGCCSDCGAPFARQTQRELAPTAKAARTFVVDERDIGADANDQGSNRQKDGHKPGYVTRVETIGWLPTCECVDAAAVPCTVLDPFCGAGTTGLVAIGHGRRFVGIELNPAYVRLAKRRIERAVGLFVRAAAVKEREAPTLFPGGRRKIVTPP